MPRDDHILGPRITIAGQLQHRCRPGDRCIIARFPVLERLCERAIGQPQDRPGRRRPGPRPEVQLSSVLPAPTTVSRSEVIRVYRQQALCHGVDPGCAAVQSVDRHDGGGQHARLRLGEHPNHASRPDDHPSTDRRDPDTEAPSCGHRHRSRGWLYGRRALLCPSPAASWRGWCHRASAAGDWLTRSARSSGLIACRIRTRTGSPPCERSSALRARARAVTGDVATSESTPRPRRP